MQKVVKMIVRYLVGANGILLILKEDYLQIIDLAITVSDLGQGYMDTRIKVKIENPEQVSYMKTTYESWTKFFEYHRKFKILAIEYEKKYKRKWETGEVYMDEKVILFNSKKAIEYAKVKDSHTEMMTKYVWMHHIEFGSTFCASRIYK